jgi:hypothetical protein
MTTQWTTPTLVEQYAEDDSHIQWVNVDNFQPLLTVNSGGVVSATPLYHIARSPKYDIKNKTYYIRATGFNFINLPTILSGIAVRLTMNRGGRITDETIQLCLENQAIGTNKADLPLEPITIYGGDSDMWKVDSIDISTVQDASFGVTLRFQSHPHWPHKTTPIINAIEIQIH